MRKIIAAIVFLMLASAGILVLMKGHPNKYVIVLLKPLGRGAVLDPTKILFVTEYDYLRTMTARLIGIERDGTYRNELAESVVFDSSKKNIKITLKKASFSDGTPITARDVYSSFKRLILKGSAHSDPRSFIKGADKIKSMDDPVEGMRVQDERTLSFELNYPIKELLYYFQLADYAVLHPSQYSKEVLSAEDWTGPVSGPYRLEWNGIDRYDFVRNKAAFGIEPGQAERVSAVKIEGEELAQSLKGNKVHFGALTFGDYLSLGPRAGEFPQIKFFGFRENLILHLDLNVRSALFRDLSVRQWVQKRIHERLRVPSSLASSMKKATQFFIPNSKGYLADSEIEEILKRIPEPDGDEVPPVLKNGFTVRVIATLNNYLPPKLETALSDVLGVPVRVLLDVKREDFPKFMEDRAFDATMMATAMDYKVLGEALNLQYISPSPPMLDPTGNIKKFLAEYHAEEDPDKEAALVRKILAQMTTDSELIPLFYILAPYFYDVDKLDVSQVNILESLQIWKMRVR